MPTRTRSCVVIAASRVREVVARGRSALRRGADLVEVRLDYLRGLTPPGLDQLAAALGRQGVATFRSSSQGGKRGSRRKEWLRRAADSGFGFIDCEWATDRGDLSSLRSAARAGRTRLIVSHHFSQPSSIASIRSMLARCCEAGDIGKVAVSTPDLTGALKLLSLARAFAGQRKKFVLIGVGEHGVITRALAEEIGCEIQYLRPERSEGVAPGQLTLSEWSRIRGRGGKILT
ncbi:MAG: type I 3-dehydroquinate dehydratase, partial [Planctomycetota bacterium]|nr:type I 3-dehydroquinate dehydratase [Planctomycetota bacterium]